MSRQRFVLTLALLAAPIAPLQAQASVAVYGRLNVGAERVEASRPAGGSAVDRLSNYRSVFGVRGTEELGDGLEAIWQIEGTVSPDTGAGDLAARDTRVGLAGRWGTFFGGQWTLPYTAATSGLDPFYPTTAGYMAVMGNGSAASTDHIGNTSTFDRRQRNVLQFWSADWHGVSTKLAYAFGEEVAPKTGATPWLASGSVSWEAGPWQWSFAHELHRAYQTRGGSDQGDKLGVAYAASALRFAAVVERLSYDTASGALRRRSVFLSVVAKTGAFSLQAAAAKAWHGSGPSVDTVGFIRSGPATGALQLTFGIDHALGRRTAAFAFYSRIHNQARAPYDFALNASGASAGAAPSVVSIGLRHAF